MRQDELEEARRLHEEIRTLERQLKTLRMATTNTVALADGMPRTKSHKSPVETLLTLIMDTEERLRELQLMFGRARMKLIRAFAAAKLSARQHEVMTLRYVACMNFRDIQFTLHLSDARVFYLHRSAQQIMRGVTDDQADG